MKPLNHAHIVTIRRDGVIDGHQLRIEGGGPGLSKYFSAQKHGGPEQSLQAAQAFAENLELAPARPRGGSPTGRVTSLSETRTAGIRFVWTGAKSGAILRVHATHMGLGGQHKHTSYSVEYNGLEGALDKAIVARTAAGAPQPDKADLLERLRQEYRSGPPL